MDENLKAARRLNGALVLVVVGGLISLSVALIVAWDLAFGEGNDGRWWTLVTSCGVVAASIFSWFFFRSMRRKLLKAHDATVDDSH